MTGHLYLSHFVLARIIVNVGVVLICIALFVLAVLNRRRTDRSRAIPSEWSQIRFAPYSELFLLAIAVAMLFGSLRLLRLAKTDDQAQLYQMTALALLAVRGVWAVWVQRRGLATLWGPTKRDRQRADRVRALVDARLANYYHGEDEEQ